MAKMAKVARRMGAAILLVSVVGGAVGCGPGDEDPAEVGILDPGDTASPDDTEEPSDRDTGATDDPDTRMADSGMSDTGGPVDTGSDDTGGIDTGGADTGVADGGMAMDTGGGMDAGPGIYVGSGNVYQTGSLSTQKFTVASDSTQSPVDAIGYAPSSAGRYPVVVLQHGFSLENGYYETILKHLASHGFVVLAPQMYTGGVFSAPSVDEEAKEARAFYDWLSQNLAGQLSGLTPVVGQLGLSGHSRGGQALRLALENGYGGATSAATIDPVDGGGGFGSGTMVTDGGFATTLPSLTIGTGLGGQTKFGMACAPANRNYEKFYAAASSPAYQMVATKYGHMEMLDDNISCGVTCSACVEGPGDGKFRRATAGWLTAFFRATLQGDQSALSVLSDKMRSPVAVTVQNK